ncbi:MAG: LacI family DNA-binding transcriptional regulator [Lacunisphaera sp.]|nr:LacI family DNA-binding transcriptional regulator [Lacunisphaera sp.]
MRQDSPGQSLPRPHRVTLKDIATESGLSIASVSMALRNNSNISSTTIQRVRLVARRLGYVPDPVLSALAEYRKSLRSPQSNAALALVTNWDTEDGWTNLVGSRLFVKGASARAAELGYSIQHIWAQPTGISRRRVDHILQTRGIRGVLLAPPPPMGLALQLDWFRYSIMAIGPEAAGHVFDYVVPNHFESVRTCWTRLTSRGHKRIGLVLDNSVVGNGAEQWEASFNQLLQRRTAPAGENVPSLLLDGDPSPDRLHRWLDHYHPDAIISGSTSLLARLKTIGIPVPGDLSYVSLGADIDVSGVSGMALQFEAMGAIAIDQLHRKLLANICGSRDVTVGCQVAGSWREGWSLQAASESNFSAPGAMCA